MNLRERLLFSMTNSDLEGWNALKELISRAICTTDGCEIWASKILDADYPSAKLCGEGLRYFDSGLLKEKPVRKKKTKVSLSGDDDLSPLERFHQSPLSVVKGVGPKIEESLKAAGIATLGDLMAFYPRDYLDLRTPIPVAQLADGEFSLIHVTLTKVMAARGRCFAEATDGSGTVRLSWFHAWPGIAAVIKKGAAFWFWGRPTLRGKEFTLSHPGFSLERPREIQVIYSKIQGVGEKTFTNIMENALALLPEEYADPLPRSIIERHEFPSWHKARKLAHRPHSELCGEDLELLLQRKHSAFIRIAYEELFFLQLALSMRQNQSRATGACRILREHHRDILSVFPFPLTAGQQQAVEEMLTDMESGIPMNRLLQGDVGSGKTAVAFILAAHIMLTGRQVACMAPTTILAQQQFITMSQWAKKLGMKSALLTSELTSGERESLLAMLESGHINLLVGTHALIQDRVRFDDLGLVIIDEQHRFGVAQRARLREKGDLPHLVVMTATPIPRTLALTAYGDLDQSIIHGMPRGAPLLSPASVQSSPKRRRSFPGWIHFCHRVRRDSWWSPSSTRARRPAAPIWRRCWSTFTKT
ncbi:DEAD/DEAH box helicase [Myxococcota bacterium]|nr:DEAD/DEAH box helicase [Myxococcota bacterium]